VNQRCPRQEWLLECICRNTSIRRVLPRDGTSKATKVALSVAVMVYYHPYNQERAINLSILNMSGINTTSVEALAVGRDMVAHGISINQNHGSFRDPPLAVRWDGPLLGSPQDWLRGSKRSPYQQVLHHRSSTDQISRPRQ
jgi:hypothetical protein